LNEKVTWGKMTKVSGLAATIARKSYSKID